MRIGAGVPAVALTAAVLGGLLAGCGGSDSGGAEASGTQSAVPAIAGGAPDGDLDVGRLSEAADIFPAGYVAAGLPKAVVSREEAEQLAGMHRAVPISYDPPRCRSLAEPFRMTEGSETAGIRSSEPRTISVLAARMPLPGPDPLVAPGCTKVAMNSPGSMTGTAEAIPAPQIPGAGTLATRSRIEGTEGGATRTIETYTLVAVLSPRTSVMVQGSEDPKLLGELLVKAVAKVRG